MSTQWPAQLQDVQLAMRWIRAHAVQLHIDPSRICVLGDSAGGHLALFLGSLKKSRPGDRSDLHSEQSPAATCVVNMFGPANLAHPDFVKVFGERPSLLRRKSVAEDPEFYASASPIQNVDAQTAPTLVIQGLTDSIVVNSLAEELVAKLEKFKVPHEYVTFNGGHWFLDIKPRSRKSEIEDQALEFVRQYLQP